MRALKDTFHLMRDEGVIHHSLRASHLFFRRQFARFVFKHHGYAIPYRVAEPARLAYQFVLRLPVNQRSLAQRADQNVKQLRIHYFPSLFITRSPNAGSISASTRSAQCASVANERHFTASFSVITTKSASGNARSRALNTWWSGNGWAAKVSPS